MWARGAAEAQVSLDTVVWIHGEGAMEKLVNLITELSEEA